MEQQEVASELLESFGYRVEQELGKGNYEETREDNNKWWRQSFHFVSYRLFSGGFGVVVRAVHIETNQTVAIKAVDLTKLKVLVLFLACLFTLMQVDIDIDLYVRRVLQSMRCSNHSAH